jgi:hypothetical protein
MLLTRLASITVLLAITQASLPVFGQTADYPGATRQTAQHATTTESGGGSTDKADCNGAPCDETQPRVIVTLPAPTPESWPWHDRALWGAYLVLALVGYAGVMLATSTLKKIERQTLLAENAASAALQSAQAALLHSQAIIDSERPWLLITVEPSLHIENSFNVMATNRGRTPATIIATLEQVKIAIDEARLPAIPEYRKQDSSTPIMPIVLLPGESTPIMPFRRDDLKGVCESEEMLKKVESWQQKVFLYGKVTYKDLIAPAENQLHETTWCCWYIHGRQKSGLVKAGPTSYNVHT